MNIHAIRWAALLLVSALSFGCQRQGLDNKRRQFESWRQIAGFEAPETVAADLRHVVFEKRRSQIHEGMLVKLDNGMSADDYMAAVKSRSLFPRGALDYSGPGSNLSWSHH
ncbi:MAG TPA: hypothetical protein VFA51_10610 [Candidatus Udaeobacter sp.]|nr:hypothetical protein [Candidatus Udaeobacter sp.]